MTEHIIDQYLEALERGETRETFLQRLPEARAEWEPLLAAIDQLRAARQIQAPESYRKATRQRLLNQITASPPPSAHRRWFPPLALNLGSWLAGNTYVSALVRVALALVFLLAGTTATAYAAQTALPGETLYPLKLISEEVQIRLSSDPLATELSFAQRRLAEVQALQEQNRAQHIPLALTQYQLIMSSWARKVAQTRIESNTRLREALQRQRQQMLSLSEHAPPEQKSLFAQGLRSLENAEEAIGLGGGEPPDSGNPAQPSPTPPDDRAEPGLAPAEGATEPTATPTPVPPSPSPTPTAQETIRPMMPTDIPSRREERDNHMTSPAPPTPHATRMPPHQGPGGPGGPMMPTPTFTPPGLGSSTPPAPPTPAATHTPRHRGPGGPGGRMSPTPTPAPAGGGDTPTPPATPTPHHQGPGGPGGPMMPTPTFTPPSPASPTPSVPATPAASETPTPAPAGGGDAPTPMPSPTPHHQGPGGPGGPMMPTPTFTPPAPTAPTPPPTPTPHHGGPGGEHGPGR